MNTFMILSVVGVFIKEDLYSGLYSIADWGLIIFVYLSIMVPALVNILLLIRSFVIKCRGKTDNKIQEEAQLNKIEITNTQESPKISDK